MIFSESDLPPLALYIHYPWCIKKCPYCDFNSHLRNDHIAEDQYIGALIDDLRREWQSEYSRTIGSIFLGGGTPSLLSGEAVNRLLQQITTVANVATDAEITIEANPGAVERQNFQQYRAAGVNRLSLGIQSFNSVMLQRIGRIHTGSDAQAAIALAQESGFDNINLDLMFALPNQTIAEALDDLQLAIAVTPSHISWYQLTVEPNTPFAHAPPKVAIEEEIDALQQQGITLLQQHGYQRYEVSAYAKEGKQSQHNRNYWQFGDYIGIGAGAHGKISTTDGSIYRYSKRRGPLDYLQQVTTSASTATQSAVAADEVVFEFMLNHLRLCEPLPMELFEARTQIARTEVEAAIFKGVAAGLLLYDGERLQTTEMGYRFLNDVVALFLE